MMKKLLYAYFVHLVVIVLMDCLWLYFSTPIFYKKQIGYLMAEKFLLLPAIVFYCLYVLSILVFIINPFFLKQEPSYMLFLKGCLFGLCSYGTYNLTNQATIKHWPLAVTVVDMAWGAFVTGFSVLVTVVLINIFLFKNQ